MLNYNQIMLDAMINEAVNNKGEDWTILLDCSTGDFRIVYDGFNIGEYELDVASDADALNILNDWGDDLEFDYDDDNPLWTYEDAVNEIAESNLDEGSWSEGYRAARRAGVLTV